MKKFKAVAYYGGIPPNNSNLEKPQILDNFVKGVNLVGDEGVGHRGMEIIDCDVALIQGFVHENGKHLPHLILRQRAFESQIKNKKKALIVDSNLFLYADPGNTKRYLRYSFNGVFPTTGFYFDRDIDPSRWGNISQDLDIAIKPYRTSGDHILVCLQRHGGWSMRGLSTIDWLDQIINQIRIYSPKRPIIIRAHPNDKKILKILKNNYKNVKLSTNTDLRQDLRNAWATVVYNSSPAVASLIEGVPVFVTDPTPSHSQSHGVANLNISDLETPKLYERQCWIEKLSMCHWNFSELQSGQAWSFFRKYIE